MDDYKNGIEKAKEIYRSIHPGGCRIISKGDSCVCVLCQCDHAVDRHLTQQCSGRETPICPHCGNKVGSIWDHCKRCDESRR